MGVSLRSSGVALFGEKCPSRLCAPLLTGRGHDARRWDPPPGECQYRKRSSAASSDLLSLGGIRAVLADYFSVRASAGVDASALDSML